MSPAEQPQEHQVGITNLIVEISDKFSKFLGMQPGHESKLEVQRLNKVNRRTGLPIMTVMGSSTASAARVHALTAAGATVNDAVVMTIGDTLIDGLAMEVHHSVDGLLGGNFLRVSPLSSIPRGRC